MNNKIKIVLVIALCIVVFVGAYLLYNNLSDKVDTNQLNTTTSTTTQSSQNSQSSTTNQPQLHLAPDFTVYKQDGTAVKLSDFRGKSVVVNFWASWCGPCKSEMPDFDAKCKEYAGEIEFLMINVTDGDRETVDSASAFIAGQGYTFPVYYDTTLQASMSYGAYSIPATFFIDENGYLVANATGALSESNLQKGIDMIYGS